MASQDADYPAEAVAIVGAACRFPGGIVDLEGLWSALVAERDLVTEIPVERFDLDRFVDDRGPRPGKSYTRAAGVLSADIAGFDAEFFGISPREAASMDPQQRLLLEMVVEALDDAGIAPARLTGSDASVFVGMSEVGYGYLGHTEARSISAYSNAGVAASIAANRLSYFLDLRGPSMAVDTACSSSLVALHQAVRTVLDGTSEVAVAAGVSLLLNPYTFIGFAQASMLSPSGRCRAFSANADGYVRAEGGGVVVLKPLARAMADGDRVHAVILGTAVNTDGRTSAMMLPGEHTQDALLRETYARAGLSPDDLAYVEAHGTGTPVGDPIECAALGRALGVRRKPGRPLPIGSVKTNLGHLEAASGMAGLLKALVVLRHREIPASLHASPLNPEIDFTGLGLAPVVRATPLAPGERAVVGVNSFGFGGANAHVVLAEAPAPSTTTSTVDRKVPVVVSARSREALGEAVRQVAKLLSDTQPQDFYDLAYTATLRHGQHPHRVAAIAGDPREAARRLLDRADRAGVAEATERGRVAFVFSGNGSQWAGMGVDLLDADPVFRAAVADIDARLFPRLGWSVVDELRKQGKRSRMALTEVAQPALFAVQLGLVETLRAKGINPSAVVGHSVGEVAAAHVAGALDLDAACLVIAARSRAQGATAGTGRMAAVGLAAADAREVIAAYPGLELAGINSAQDVTISGDATQLAALGTALAEDEVFFRELGLDYAFHSPAMDAIEHALPAELAELVATEPRLTVVSTVTGAPITDASFGAHYWWRNVREPVLFASAMDHLVAQGFDTFVEIGPHPVLRTYLRRLTAATNTPTAVVPTLARDTDGAQAITNAVLSVIEAGAEIDWDVHFPYPGRVVTMPAYPWQRRRHWSGDTRKWPRSSGDGVIDHPLLGERMPVAEPTWTGVVEPVCVQWLADHQVGGSVVMPAAAFADMALRAGRLVHDAAVEVTDLQISKALVIPWADGPETHLQTSLSDEDGVLRIASRIDGVGEWRTHTTGRVRRLFQPEPDQLDLPALRARLSVHCGAEEVYARATEAGIDYGPAFRVLRELDAAEDEVLAAYHSEAPRTGFEVHPAVLDGALQAGAPLLASIAPGHAFIPASIGVIRCWSQPPATGFVHVRSRVRDARFVRWDIVITDDVGDIAVELRDVWLRRFDAVGGEPLQCYTTVLRAAPEENAPPEHVSAPSASELVARTKTGQAGDDDEFHALSKHLFAQQAVAALRRVLSNRDVFTQQDLVAAGVLPKYLKLIDLLLPMAHAAGLAEQAGKRTWRLRGTADPRSLVRKLVEGWPGRAAELALVNHVGARLAEVLRGEVDAVELIFKDGAAFVEQYYDIAPFRRAYNQVIRSLVHSVVAGWPGDRPLRVLEIGGGTGATAAALLPVLPPERTSYVFTDRDAGVFPKAQQRFAAHEFVGYRELDLDQDLAEQGFPDTGFDIVIASAALHATTDLSRSARRVSRLLADGGVLLAFEVHDPELLAMPFGLLDDFWGFTDTKLRPRSPLLSGDAWTRLLRKAGFGDVALTGHGAAASVIVASQTASVDAEHALPAVPSDTRWILAIEDGTESELAAAVADRLAGASVITAPDDADAWATEVAGADIARVVLVLAAEGEPVRRAAIMRAIALASDRASPATGVTFCLVTRPSGALPEPERPDAPRDAAAWGTARSLGNERPELKVRLVSLDRRGGLPRSAIRLARELLTPTEEDEVVLTRGGRFVPRTTPAQPAVTPVAGDDIAPYTLAVRDEGLNYRLSWEALSPAAPGPDEVAISVRASALNYRDIMQAVGYLPPETVVGSGTENGLGCECSGVITAVGSQVTAFRPGDEVVAMAPAALSSHVVVRGEFVAPLPRGLSFAEAATLPVVAATVHYSLETLARLAPGETLLVHGGAGGVGLAAVQYAQHRGATVIATAGSEIKRDFLRTLGVEHVFDSRDLSFAPDVMAVTEGRGVDVVLNSLAGEAITRSLELLRARGRFIELGKRDILENKRLPLRPLRHNISLFCVDLSAMDRGESVFDSGLMTEVGDRIASGVYRPLPHAVYPASRVGEAFQLLQHSRHIGKVIVDFDDTVQVESPVTQPELSPNATYLVTGGLGGFGAATARWLADRGARHLALVGRRGPDSPEAPALLAEFTARGVTATAYRADVTDFDSMRQVLADIEHAQHPLRGVIHAAMRLDDAPLAELDGERFRTALAPKMQGALVLDELTRDSELDFFVLYSSVSALVGNIGQANYNAGNLFLEALARARRAAGLPGQAIAWGAIGEVGYVARTGTADGLAKAGLRPMRPAAALTELGAVLGTGTDPVIGVLDWGRVGAVLSGVRAPRLAANLPPVIEGTGQDRDEFLRQVLALPEEEGLALLQQAVLGLLAGVLQTTPDRIEPTARLDQLGMDSLMAAELLVSIRQRLGCEIPIMEMARGGSIADLSRLAHTRLRQAR